jgi:tetratricopeptide (TPR) repeat protein
MATAFAVLFPAAVLAPFALAADDGKKEDAPKASVEKKHDPQNQTALSEFMELCLQGNAKFVAKDVNAAIELYKRAIAQSPKNGLGHYLLGEAQLASGNLAEAEASWKTAEQTTDDRNATLRGRVLFVLADVKERQKKWDEAKAAWQAYGEYAAKHVDAGASPQTSTSRGQAIEDMLKQDKLYEVVRQRIAAEKDAGPEPVDAGAAKKK